MSRYRYTAAVVHSDVIDHMTSLALAGRFFNGLGSGLVSACMMSVATMAPYKLKAEALVLLRLCVCLGTVVGCGISEIGSQTVFSIGNNNDPNTSGSNFNNYSSSNDILCITPGNLGTATLTLVEVVAFVVVMTLTDETKSMRPNCRTFDLSWHAVFWFALSFFRGFCVEWTSTLLGFYPWEGPFWTPTIVR